jgi:hypothetical protein
MNENVSMKPEPIPGRCGARTRHGFCKKWPVKGRTRCFKHGGKTPVGIATKNFKTGLFSKSMPRQFAQKFAAAASDPELLSLARHVALINTRLLQLLEEFGQARVSVVKVKEAKAEFLKAHASGDQAALQVATNFMMKAIDGSVDEDDRWEKIDWAVESVRKLIDSIQKHQVQTAQIMTLMQAQALFTNLAMSVRKGFVGLAAQTTDERMKKLIQAALHLVAAEFQRAANMPDPLASISKETMLQ